MAKGTRKLEIIISASAKKAHKVFAKLKTGMRNVVSAGARIGTGLAAGFAVATAAVTALIVKVLNLGDDLGKTADRLGVTTEELSALRHAGQLAGLEIGDTDRALQFMQRNLAEAADGMSTQADAFAKLGVSLDDIKKKSPADQMQEIVRALEGIEDSSTRVQVAMDIFGRSGAQVLNMTAEGMAEARKEAEMFGIAMSRADAKQMENINDAMTRVKSAITGAAIQLVKQFAPTLEAVGNKLAEWSASGALSKWAKDLGKFLVEVIPKGLLLVIDLAGRVMNVFRGWEMLVTELKIGFLSFQEVVWGGLNVIRNGVTATLEALNVGGIFDQQLKDSQRIASEQETILKSIADEKTKALQQQQENIRTQKEEQSQVEKIKKNVDEFVKSINNGTSSVEGQTQKVNELASAYDKAATSAQKFVTISSGGSTTQRTFGDDNLLTNLSRTEGD